MKFSSETQKYLIRFGMIAAILAPILIWAQGPEAIKIITYKACLVAGGLGFAETVWAVWFKPTFGKMENNVNATDHIYLFRGLLYGAIIIAFTLGL